MTRIATLAGAAALALSVGAFSTGSAQAAVTVYGSGFAETCFHVARDGGDLFAGIADCGRALVEDQLEGRDLAGTYVNRGVLYMGVNQYAAASYDMQKAIAIDPKLGEAWINLGALLIAEHHFADGIAAIDKGLALGPQEPEKAYYNRALGEEGQNDEKAAYFDYLKASELKPNWAPPRTELTRFSVHSSS